MQLGIISWSFLVFCIRNVSLENAANIPVVVTTWGFVNATLRGELVFMFLSYSFLCLFVIFGDFRIQVQFSK